MSAQASGEPLWLKLRRDRVSPSNLLEYFEIDRAPVNVFEIARRMGIRLSWVPGAEHCGVVSSSPTGEATITLRDEDSKKRQRFTVAHEIAHLLMHPLGKAYRDDSYTGNPQEHEANAFASELLMPDELLDAAVQRYGADPKVLAPLFLVSDLSMRVRLMRWTEL